MWGDEFEDKKAVYQAEIAPYLLVALYRFGGVASLKDGIEKTLDLLDISDELRNRRSGKFGYLYMGIQIKFSMSMLRGAEYIKTPKNSLRAGSWELTAKGTDLAEKINKNLEDTKIVEELRSEVQKIIKKQAKSRKLSQDEESIEDEKDEAANTDEAEVEEAKQESIRTDIQAIHDDLNPIQFEQLCVRLLNAMGAEMKITQGSHDHGVDAKGFIRTGLAIDEVAAQFKRYDPGTSIGERYINELAGSMGSADRGIFITTSSYSKNGKEAAQKHSIRLIDGEELVELMREHEIMYKRVLDLKS